MVLAYLGAETEIFNQVSAPKFNVLVNHGFHPLTERKCGFLRNGRKTLKVITLLVINLLVTKLFHISASRKEYLSLWL